MQFFTLNIIAALLLAVSTSTVAAAQKSSNLRGGGRSLFDGCRGMDSLKNEVCRIPKSQGGCLTCPKPQITCWSIIHHKYYCENVDMDAAVDEATPAAVDEATPAPLDQVSPTRKLQEEGEILTPPPTVALESSVNVDAQSDGCPWPASRVPEHDGICPELDNHPQIMCHFGYDFCVKVDTDAAVDEATSAPPDQVSPTRTLQEDGETSTTPPQTVALESSPTLDAQGGDGCPGADHHAYDHDHFCAVGHIMCMDVNPWHKKTYYCYLVKKVDMDAAVDTATPAPLDQVSPTRKLEEDRCHCSKMKPSASESSPTLDAQAFGCPCPGLDCHAYDRDHFCAKGHIMCMDMNPLDKKTYYCHLVKKVDMDAAVDEATSTPTN